MPVVVTAIGLQQPVDLADVLAKDVRILGIFSDWPAAVTCYANRMGLK
jgi:glycerophosphoryl diester phosphodiesterase